MDSDLEEFAEDDSAQSGLLTKLFAYSVIEVKKVNKDTIEFVISAPDMTAVFKGMPDNAINFTENDLYEYIIKYASSADLTEVSVEVPFSSENGEIIIEYHNEAYINAATGGLLDAYKDLYIEMLDQYREAE